MSELHQHASHSAIVTRLKRAEGHLRHVIAMIEGGSPCPDIATQLLAVERAVGEHNLAWSPIVGLVVMAVGGVVYLVGEKKL